MLAMFVAQSLGLLIGAVIQDPKSALSVATVLVLSIMLVAGFYVEVIPVCYYCLMSVSCSWLDCMRKFIPVCLTMVTLGLCTASSIFVELLPKLPFV